MALKALMLRKRLNDAIKQRDALTAKDAEYEKREAEIAASIEEAETEEEQAAVEEAVEGFEADKAAHEQQKEGIEGTIRDLEAQLSEEEARQDTTPADTPAEAHEERKEVIAMDTRSRIFRNMSVADRTAMFEREDVKAYLAGVRTAIKEKRAITNVGLTIPEVFLGLLRQTVGEYSKLYKHVTVRPISGTGREVIQGDVPEAIWTECCATLNELSIGFNDVEVDCYKVGGYFKECNAILEDSDIDLAATLLDAIAQAIGKALDKSMIYGRNAATTMKMPQGIVSRLVQTEAPTGYPATARPWADLHTSNIKTIAAANSTGIKLFQQILLATNAIRNNYATGNKVWVMNEGSLNTLKAEAMGFNAAGAIVSGMENTMPVVGGAVEILNFIPDNVIIVGYFGLYLLAERAGAKFAESEHVYFIQDQTVFKGTARYDGTPVIPEAFAAIGIAGVTPNATMTFPSDTANA